MLTVEQDTMIRQALDAAGYYDDPATEEALINCFLDYVAAGYWRDLDYIDAQEDIKAGLITKQMMIKALKRDDDVYGI